MDGGRCFLGLIKIIRWCPRCTRSIIDTWGSNWDGLGVGAVVPLHAFGDSESSGHPLLPEKTEVPDVCVFITTCSDELDEASRQKQAVKWVIRQIMDEGTGH